MLGETHELSRNRKFSPYGQQFISPYGTAFL